MEVILSERAEQQIARIESYLAERFYPENAARFVSRLVDSFDTLRAAPYQGTQRDDGIRIKGFERKVSIYFDIRGDRVRILSVQYRGKVPRKIDLQFREPRR